ncbi:MAG: diguanylate cyclase [Sedimentibacter sp.]
MNYRSRFILLLISTVVGIPYIFYNHVTFQNVGRLFVDITVFIVVSTIFWLLGKYYDELTQNNQELESTQEEMQELFDNADAMFWSTNLITKKTTVSKGIERIFGITNDDFSENSDLWLRVTYPEDKDKVNKFFKTLLSGKISELDWRISYPDGEIRWVHCSGRPIFNESGTLIKLVGVAYDITDRKLAEQKTQHLAYHDILTNLPNRRFLYDYLKRAISRSKRNSENFSILFIDLDEFKNTNDRYGHEAGDVLLNQVALRLKKCIRQNDFASRIGGDEFVVVLECRTKNECIQITDRIINTLSKPYHLNDSAIGFLTVSIGISQYPNDGDTPDVLIKKADEAMYLAKNQGKNNAKYYSSEF